MKKQIKKIYLISLFSAFFLVPVCFAGAESAYTLLEPIGDLGANDTVTFSTYLAGLYNISIGLAAVLAVLQLSYGGFKYLTEESFTGKSNAREKITNALYGLILVLSAYLLLNFINSDLVNTDLVIPSTQNIIERSGGEAVFPDPEENPGEDGGGEENTPPSCGDGSCNGEETQASCPSDCEVFIRPPGDA